MDLHAALATLSPLDQSALPDDDALPSFLDAAFSAAATIIDTLPVPPAPLSAPATTRPRSVSAASALSTASSTSTSNNGSTERLNIVPSAARPQPSPAASTYAREWKEVKPGGANPHDIRVYKLTAKDNGGAWFLRRSVHEGIGFARFRRGLRREFEESLYRRRGVGREPAAATDGEERGDGWEGMVIPQGVRGIGVERRLERRVAKGVGRIDVLHLSAQFPGPSAPRDFVTACMSSSAAAPPRTAASTSSNARRKGREFTMVSRPLTHPDAPEQPGFVRGKYESIEFIREIVPTADEDAGPRRSLSVSDLAARASLLAAVEEQGRPKGRPRSRTVGETPRKAVSFGRTVENGAANPHRASNLRVAISADDIPDEEDEPHGAPAVVVSPSEDAEESLENEEGEANPVEWIMLTRSDPGGSVPRFMVDRGTPGSIVRDAEKFLDWACEKVHHDDDLSDDEHEPQTTAETTETEVLETEDKLDNATADELRRAMSRDDSASNLSFMTASSGEREDDEPDELDESSGSLGSSQTTGQINGTPTSSMLDIEPVNGRARSDTATTTSASAAVQRLQTDAERAAAKARTSREKDDRKAATRLAKEEEKQRKLAEKHARDAARREEKYRREQAKAEEKRRKEEDKIRERKRRLEERDEKVRHLREIEDLKREVELLRRENEVLRREMALVTGVPVPPSRSSSSLAATAGQRPASPASSSASSRGRKTRSALPGDLQT
ncbi:hypothetical protein TWF696_002428 [Orbilia brochopaga]|uniref:DUF3074 domain-containing protein n=1 Tax=Orbilia brochopaga TaxID=3140254 RepID=A0AAV9U7N4_9PEZI